MLTERQGIHELLQSCPRLTHLSLTGVQAFLREDLTRFCREAPPEFTLAQREVFCVFSGEGVSRLREYLKRLAEDQEREGRISMERTLSYSETEADPSKETVSDDDTIDGPKEMAERRRTFLPGSAGFRSYAEVVSGSGSRSPEREEGRAGNDVDLPLPQASNGRTDGVFRRRSSGLGSSTERQNGTSFRGYVNGHDRREGSRRVSEGQETSNRAMFFQFEASTYDISSPAASDTQNGRPLPPRPHWPPQAQTAPFFEGEPQIFVPDWGDTSAVRASPPTPSRGSRSGPGPGPGDDGRESRYDSTANAVYETDEDDGETTLRQTSRRHREMDGEMEC